jgi:hypothetical protein
MNTGKKQKGDHQHVEGVGIWQITKRVVLFMRSAFTNAVHIISTVAVVMELAILLAP